MPRMLAMCVAVGVVAGLGAAGFFVLLELASSLLLGGMAHYHEHRPHLEQAIFKMLGKSESRYRVELLKTAWYASDCFDMSAVMRCWTVDPQPASATAAVATRVATTMNLFGRIMINSLTTRETKEERRVTQPRSMRSIVLARRRDKRPPRFSGHRNRNNPKERPIVGGVHSRHGPPPFRPGRVRRRPAARGRPDAGTERAGQVPGG